jgi:hypothetical protein
MKFAQSIRWTFLALIVFLYAVIFSGQILGLLKIYHPLVAVFTSLIIGGLVFFLLESNRQWFDEFLPGPPSSPGLSRKLLEIALFSVGAALFVLLAILPLLRWPFSSISRRLSWDAGLYHFPKAIEMIVTGSAWDMTIDYGEYPFGYESLLAFTFGINPEGYLLGLTHALIAFFFLLVFWLVIRRFTNLPHGMIVFVVSLIMVSRLYVPQNDNNIWWIIWTQVVLIGKNDLLLGAMLLSIVLFTPRRMEDAQQNAYLPGLAISSMLALSVKPNAALLVLFSWALALLFLGLAQGWQTAFKKLFLYGLLILPGVLWSLRNLIAMGSLFKENASKLSGFSIAANLTNPYFYDYIPTQLYLVLLIALLPLIVAPFWRKMVVPALIGLILLLTFAFTPASAFLGNNQQPTQIAWRFAVGLLAYQAIMLLMLFGPIIRKVHDWLSVRLVFSVLAVGFILGLGAFGLYRNQNLFSETVPNGDLVLRDQFRASVGVDGYFSAYDYVQKNVRNATVIVENGLPYYLYDKPFTNSVTRSRNADYFVAFQTAWIAGREEAYPEMIFQPEFEQNWELVYEDSEGRVYKRKP